MRFIWRKRLQSESKGGGEPNPTKLIGEILDWEVWASFLASSKSDEGEDRRRGLVKGGCPVIGGKEKKERGGATRHDGLWGGGISSGGSTL